jgi:hypothetical protein
MLRRRQFFAKSLANRRRSELGGVGLSPKSGAPDDKV